MIDFPASPTVGQTFTAAGVTWTYDGAKWTLGPSAPNLITRQRHAAAESEARARCGGKESVNGQVCTCSTNDGFV